MAKAKGNYDDVSEGVLHTCGADTVVMLVLGGNKGDGFSVSSQNPDIQRQIPTLMRVLADDIERATFAIESVNGVPRFHCLVCDGTFFEPGVIESEVCPVCEAKREGTNLRFDQPVV